MWEGEGEGCYETTYIYYCALAQIVYEIRLIFRRHSLFLVSGLNVPIHFKEALQDFGSEVNLNKPVCF